MTADFKFGEAFSLGGDHFAADAIFGDGKTFRVVFDRPTLGPTNAKPVLRFLAKDAKGGYVSRAVGAHRHLAVLEAIPAKREEVQEANRIRAAHHAAMAHLEDQTAERQNARREVGPALVEAVASLVAFIGEAEDWTPAPFGLKGVGDSRPAFTIIRTNGEPVQVSAGSLRRIRSLYLQATRHDDA